MKQLKEIRENNKDLEVIFIFLDIITFKLIKCSIDIEEKPQDIDVITFIDYNDEAKYFIPLNKANRILDYCYNEYFFKVVLSGSDFYNKVKKVSLDLEMEPFIFDLFFRSFFLGIKEVFKVDFKSSPQDNKNLLYRIVGRAPSDSFNGYSNIDHNFYFSKSTQLLKKLEELRIISFDHTDITKDERLRYYFAISCDTFKFYPNRIEPGLEFFSQIFEYFDLKTYLDNQDYLNSKFLNKLDKCIQMIILICFKDVRFYNNEYSDNSYIKHFNLNRRLLYVLKT